MMSLEDFESVFEGEKVFFFNGFIFEIFKLKSKVLNSFTDFRLVSLSILSY